MDITKIRFTQYEDKISWARDYGADILIDDEGNMRLINFKFNTYGEEEGTDEISIASAKITAESGDILNETWNYLWNHQKSLGLVGDTLKDGSQFPTGKIKMQPALSYCNFLIVNGIVLGQSYWKEGLPLSIKEKDEQAKKVLETIFPDRKVITINTTALNILGGGIHCITKNIAHPNGK